MNSQLIVILSAMTVAIALTGLVVALCILSDKDLRGPLSLILFILAGLSGSPLAQVFGESLVLFYLPGLLPLLFLLPVAIYGYARGLTQAGSPDRKRTWRHYVLPMASLAIMFGYWSLPDSDKSTLFLRGELPTGYGPAALALITFTFVLVWPVSSFAYLIATLKILRRYRDQLKEFYADPRPYDLRWFDGHLIGLIGLWAIVCLALLSDNLFPAPLIPTSLVYGLAIIFLLTLITFSLSTALVPEPVSLNDVSETSTREKYMRSALSDEQSQRISRKIDDAMRKAALHRDPHLTLLKLARHIRAPQNHVSQTLNMHIGKSFFDYVAHWRVEASKPLLTDSQKAIHDIALEVGFNARSSFYKAFKRETGMTPRAYRLAAREEGTSHPDK